MASVIINSGAQCRSGYAVCWVESERLRTVLFSTIAHLSSLCHHPSYKHSSSAAPGYVVYQREGVCVWVQAADLIEQAG